MLFTTLEYAYFFAAVFLIYHLIPERFKWVVLCAASGYFYFKAGVYAFVLLAAISLVSYAGALLIDRHRKKSGILLTASVLIILLTMALMRLPFVSFIMPLGYSFYALQCIAYMTEVQREGIEVMKNPLKVFLYVSYFPHVLQGPFEDPSEYMAELFAGHGFSYEKAREGLLRILWGLLKKLVIADRIGYIVDPAFEDPAGCTGFRVLYVMALYTIQLYADFSGYMDMAVGSSKMLGIEIRENFNVPYLSKSMAEFWRRWHMSLGLWFKAYVFYPVLRTKPCAALRTHFKKKKNRYLMNTLPTAVALTVNWTLIGLWHGFDANYLAYDWFCGAVIILSEFLKPVYDKVNSSSKFFKSSFCDGLRVVRNFVLVMFSFMFFRPATLQDSFTLMGNAFHGMNLMQCLQMAYNVNSYDLFLIAVPLIMLIVADVLKYKGKDPVTLSAKAPTAVRWAVYIILILMIYIGKGDRSVPGPAYIVF